METELRFMHNLKKIFEEKKTSASESNCRRVFRSLSNGRRYKSFGPLCDYRMELTQTDDKATNSNCILIGMELLTGAKRLWPCK